MVRAKGTLLGIRVPLEKGKTYLKRITLYLKSFLETLSFLILKKTRGASIKPAWKIGSPYFYLEDDI